MGTNWDIFSTPSSDSTQRIKIAVMSGTGCGKSTFINLVAGSELGVSAGLASCTQDVQEANFTLDGQTINLIDTPGFDDTERSDVEILKLIADYLATRYKSDDQLHGILYFHRICDIRMGGASKRSFRLFRKLCGEDTLKNVVIVTNMWDKVTPNEGETRENELINDDKFFKSALNGGARIYRHHNTLPSAQKMLRLISNNPRSKASTLDIQKELVDDEKELVVTGAGQELESDLRTEAKDVARDMDNLEAELSEAKNEDDKQAMKELQDELAASRRRFARVQNELTNLKVGLDNDVDFEAEVDRAPERFKFWAALGDTTKTSAALSEIFEKNAVPTQLYDALFDQEQSNALTPQLNRDLGAWIRGCPKAVKGIETIMEKAIKKAKKEKKPWWRLW